MADNFVANVGSGGNTYASDEISTVHYPRSKLIHGADGTNDGDVSMANGLPVQAATSASWVVTNAGTFSVQASAIIPGTGATNLGKAEDAIHASGDTGVAVLAVRRDSQSAGGAVDGDYACLAVDQSGGLYVRVAGGSVSVIGGQFHDSADTQELVAVGGVANSSAPTNVASSDYVSAWYTRFGAANVVIRDGVGDSCMDDALNALRVNIIAGAGSGGTALADEAAFTEGSTSFTPVGGVFNDSITSDPTEDQAACARITAKRALHVNLRDATGAEVAVGGGTQYDEDTAATAGEKMTMAGVVRADTAGSRVDANGDRTELIVDGSGKLWVRIENDDASNFIVGCIGQEDHDEPAVSAPFVFAGRASAAAPANVSADGDVAWLWSTRAGAMCSQLVATGGALIGGDATNGLDVDVTRVSGNVTVVNGGTFAVQIDAGAVTSLALIDDTVFTDDAAFTPGTSKVLAVGFQADETGTDSVDEGDAGAARMTLDRKQIVTTQPHTAGGLSIFRSLDLDETEEEVKATAGCVYGVWVTNTTTATIWLKFYNATAANVTVGSTTPVLTIGIPGNASDDITGMFSSGNGIMFDTAITVAATTGFADADTGAPAANALLINVFYK